MARRDSAEPRLPIDGGAGPPVLETLDGIRCFSQQQDSFVAVPLHLPLGFISADDFSKIGDAAQRFSGESGLRTTRSQNLLIRFVKRDDVRALADDLRRLESDVLSSVPLERFVACAGASTCRLGLCMARDAARACAAKLDGIEIKSDTLNALDVYINGCPNACGHQPVGPIGFLGAARRREGRLVPTYRITLGGRCNADGARLGVPVGKVPANALPVFLDDLAKEFDAGRRNGELFSSYVDRMGESHFEKVVSRHAEVPAHDEYPEFYRDFAVEEDFSLAGRGAGECGAGVLEVIQEDISAAKKAREPFDILLPTVRSLLITRGVDAQDADAIFREFEKHFIDTGLVAEGYRALLTRARAYTQGWKQAFDGHEETVSNLLQRVELVYSTLDANLEFHPPEPVVPQDSGRKEAEGAQKPTLDGSGGVTHELDLRGVVCPMNFVKSKLRLESMNVGETLAIILDDGEPIRNVPASFRSEGQAIKEVADLGDGHWRVIVRKER